MRRGRYFARARWLDELLRWAQEQIDGHGLFGSHSASSPTLHRIDVPVMQAPDDSTPLRAGLLAHEPVQWPERNFAFGISMNMFPLVLERLRGTPIRARDVVSGASERLLSTRLNQKWSAKEHLGHLSDLHSLEERRLREFLANASTLSPADPMNRATETADHNQRSIGAVLGLLRVYRAEFVAKLENLSEKDLCRTAIHPRLQTSMRMLDWMSFIAEHDDHHLAKARQVLRELRFSS